MYINGEHKWGRKQEEFAVEGGEGSVSSILALLSL